jgi:hypothetical protein
MFWLNPNLQQQEHKCTYKIGGEHIIIDAVKIHVGSGVQKLNYHLAAKIKMQCRQVPSIH